MRPRSIVGPLAHAYDRPMSADSPLSHRMPPHVAEVIAALPKGSSANGFLHVVEPAALDDTLAEWLGGHDPTRTPFARTALGDLLYVRDLREKARSLGLDAATAESAHDISAIDVRYKQTKLLFTDVNDLTRSLADDEWLRANLDKALYDAAVDRLGPPDFDEIYTFVPALALGGAPDPANLRRNQADVALSILFQL